MKDTEQKKEGFCEKASKVLALARAAMFTAICYRITKNILGLKVEKFVEVKVGDVKPESKGE